MASQANVYTVANAQPWYTDKARINTGNTAVTFNVYLAPAFTDTIYSANVQVPPSNSYDTYVGIGNRITINGANFTAEETGSQGRT